MLACYEPLTVKIWVPVNQPVGRGYAPKRPWTVQKLGEWFASNGRVHRYKTEAHAQKIADLLNLRESDRAAKAAPSAKEPT
jgi:hypothetical protein